jgi:hypothetical protein
VEVRVTEFWRQNQQQAGFPRGLRRGRYKAGARLLVCRR